MISIAIDGPAGAGKSSISKILSDKLGFIHVDTGALYRTIALYMIENNISIADKKLVEENLANIIIKLKFTAEGQRVLLNGKDVNDFIRTPEISMGASDVSAIACVRAFLLDLQRDLAKENNVIMDGRDIATVVLPNADFKIFLTASAEIRADRRYKEMVEKNIKVCYNDILEDIKTRDYNDSHREIAPLKPSSDSIIVDSSILSIEQVVENLEKIIKEKN